MQQRIFKESWSQGMKNMIANMSDSEYNEWVGEYGTNGTVNGPTKSIPLTDKEIQAWVNSKEYKTMIDDVVSRIM